MSNSNGKWQFTHMEMVNWGLYDGYHVIDATFGNILITGNNGTGKSTIFDAYDTVMHPKKYRFYNQAAQGSTKKQGRTLAGYMRGACGEDDDEEGNTQNVYLRGNGAIWSGILLRFEWQKTANANSSELFPDTVHIEPLNLIALFNLPNNSNKNADVKEVYIVADGAINLGDLQQFVTNGIDTKKINRYLDERGEAGKYDSFSSNFRNRLGISKEETFDLLQKVQGINDETDLNKFFRIYLLDEPETPRIIDESINNFNNLRHSREIAVGEREKMNLLEPLQNCKDVYDEACKETEYYDMVMSFFPAFMAQKMTENCKREKHILEKERIGAEGERQNNKAQWDAAELRKEELQTTLNNQSGANYESIKKEAEEAKKHLTYVEKKEAGLRSKLKAIGITQTPVVESEWVDLIAKVEDQIAESKNFHPNLDQDILESYGRKREIVDERQQVKDELEHLKHSDTNIPKALHDLRSELAQDVGSEPKDLPFICELVNVKAEYGNRQGCIERILSDCATTLLIPEDYEDNAIRFLDSKNLGMRLKHVLVPSDIENKDVEARENSLPNMLSIVQREDHSEFSIFVRNYLLDNADYTYVEDIEGFKTNECAATCMGYTKADQVYVKNDQQDILDKKAWILGSDNKRKQEQYQELFEQLSKDEEEIDQKIDTLNKVQETMRKSQALMEYFSQEKWEDHDCNSAQIRCEAADESLKLFESNPEIQTLGANLEKTLIEIEECKKEHDRLTSRFQRIDDRCDELSKKIDQRRQKVQQWADLDNQRIKDDLEGRYREYCPEVEVAESFIDRVGNEIRDEIYKEQKEIDERKNAALRQAEAIMVGFSTKWPDLSSDLSTKIEDFNSYQEIYNEIKKEGLPKHVEDFTNMLNKFMENDLLIIGTAIDGAGKKIDQKIRPVNEVLRKVTFDKDTYLRIDKRPCPPRQVVELKQTIKVVGADFIGSNGVNAGDFENAEEKYAAVENIMMRFINDKKWRAIISDTRNHYNFSIIEYDQKGNQKRRYSTSESLSGAERQRLTSFCLAATIYSQLIDDMHLKPTFTTVIIDEAFDKSDVNFTKNAIDAFEEFGFQMVLGTPNKCLDLFAQHAHTVCVTDKNKETEIGSLHVMTKEKFVELRDVERDIQDA